jgi:broad specificity phosphatase PhoE
MQKTTLYVVRHGESVSNRQGIIAGHVDPDLTEEGKAQVAETKEALQAAVSFDAAYSSDLIRAVHTAEILYGKPVPKNHRLYNLRERNFGSLEGKPEHHLKAGSQKRKRLTDEEGWAFRHVPDMESDHELTARFLPALEEIARNNKGKTVLVVAHGGSIRTAIMKLTGYTYKQLPAGSFVNAGYVEIVYDPGEGFRVMQINGVKL